MPIFKLKCVLEVHFQLKYSHQSMGTPYVNGAVYSVAAWGQGIGARDSTAQCN